MDYMGKVLRSVDKKLQLFSLMNLRLSIILVLVCCIDGLVINPEVSTLLKVQSTLSGTLSNTMLLSWNVSRPVCRWKGVSWLYDGTPINCSLIKVRRSLSLAYNPKVSIRGIYLQGAGLKGMVPKELGSLTNLKWLNLNNNSLQGEIPPELGNVPNLSSLQLKSNELSGSIPATIWNLSDNLVELVLGFNGLSENIHEPPMANGSFPFFKRLELNNNSLSGVIPSFLATCSSLQILDLSGNSLSGSIPNELANLPNLTTLNLAHNNLSGRIPSFRQKFDKISFVENSASLCGQPLLNPCNLAPAASANITVNQLNLTRGHAKPSTGVIAGIIIGSIAVVVIVASLVIGCYHKSNRDGGVDRTSSSSSAPPKEKEEDMENEGGKLIHFQGGEHLTVDDVLNATGEVMGKSSYGTVYKARLRNGSMIALRLLRDGCLRSRGEFMPAIEELGKIRHGHLVSLRAFYSGTRGEKLLAYDYLPRGSLSELLHSTNRQAPGWARRHKIALGAARGLAYLHTGLPTSIIHGNIKSKNILVDDNYVAHLSDYGLHKLMNTTANLEMLDAAASQGYKAPELVKMKKANAKTDIYSFGIVLLEILTGRRSGRTDSSGRFIDLPTIVKTAVLEERISELFDLELLRGMRSPADEGLLQVLQLAMGCCAPSPSVRPHVKEVVRQLEEIRPKSQSPLYTPSPQYNSDDKSSREFLL
ncbi:putative kinase-like protein TMKL1 [Cryptomeria japonica]|uniref:putative kinase-like protein TMKL1 n=1 Tax=Cryptomeria japonica TaxID=3369 RepID=UPI0027DA5FCC|nr:putative kinase-like protein TMKL1 [Cryptomeria japonica]